MTVDLKIPKSNVNNQVVMSGNITVTEEISGNLDFVLENNRCNLDLTKCEQEPNLNINEVCKKLKQKNVFYSIMFEAIKPPLACPIQPGNYTVEKFSIDLSLVSMLPIDGYIWIVNFKLVSSVKGNRTKQIVACINSEVKVVKIRQKQ